MLVMGTRGTMTIGTGGIDVTGGDDTKEHHDAPTSMGYREEFQDFHRAVVTGTSPTSTFLEGYRDLEVILAAIDGSQQNNRFTLGRSRRGDVRSGERATARRFAALGPKPRSRPG